MLLNYVPALIWAKRLDEADAAAARLGSTEPTAPWAAAVTSWFHGLVCEARGDRPGALAHLTSALTSDLELPLYRAHLLADHARLARLLGRADADGSLRQAEAIYEQLGAMPYLERVRAIRSTPANPVGLAAGSLAGGVALTEREQDVLTLLVSGMSYAPNLARAVHYPEHRRLSPRQHLRQGRGDLAACAQRDGSPEPAAVRHQPACDLIGPLPVIFIKCAVADRLSMLATTGALVDEPNRYAWIPTAPGDCKVALESVTLICAVAVAGSAVPVAQTLPLIDVVPNH